MDRLVKTVLIKSAKYDYTEVELDKNNLFIGANGAGKTTLLRAILYFYTANAKGLGISSAKKISFLDYYFPYDDSYILYLYKKDQKYVLVTLYKSTKIAFRFCLLDSKPDIKSLFIEKNYPVAHATLFAKLREIGTLSKSLSASEYRDVLYSKQNKLRYFSLFEAKEYDGFVKTLANIFVNNKVDSEAIKKVIVSSLRVEKEIDIERIQRQLGEFNRTYEDIVAYEKSLKDIEKLLSLLYEFEKIKLLLGENIASLFYSKERTQKSLKELYEAQSKIAQALQDMQQEMEKKRLLFEKRDKRLEQEIGKYKALVKKAKEKTLYYEKEKIEEKIEAFDALASLKEELRLLLLQKEFLTKEATELRLSHENRLKAIENTYNRLLNSIEKEQNAIELDRVKQIASYRDEQREALSDIEQQFGVLLQEQKEQQHKLSLLEQKLKNSLENEKRRSFVFEKEDSIVQHQSKLQEFEQALQEKKHTLELLDASLSKEEVSLQREEAYLLEQKEQNSTVLEQKILRLRELLAPKKSSLLYALEANGYDLDKYLYCVKDEVLHSEIDLVSNTEKRMQLFEVDMSNVAIPQNSLAQELQALEEQLQERQKYFLMEIEKVQEAFKKRQKSIYRQKRELVDAIKSIERTINEHKTALSHLAMQKETAAEHFKAQQAQTVAMLEESLKKQKQDYAELTQVIQREQAEKKRAISSKKAHFTKLINELDQKYNLLLAKLQEKASHAKQDQEEDLKKQERLYKERLREKNVDLKALSELEKQEERLQRDIATVEDFYPLIIAYENDKKEYIDRIKEYEGALKEHQQEQKKLQTAYDLALQKDQEAIAKLQENDHKNSTTIEKNKRALQRVEEFQKSSSMQECRALELEYSSNENFEDIEILLDTIHNLLGNYRENEKKITTAINRLHSLFNTSLNIKRFEDPLASAYSIEEFHTNEKIKEFKDLQARNLNQIVKNVVEEYDNLMFYSQKIEALIKRISKLFTEIEIGVIDELSLRYLRTNNRVIEKLFAVKELNNENPNGYGISLFNDSDNSKAMIELLKSLRDTIELENVGTINLEDSFVLEFRVVENGNDSKYQPSLDNIGSNGTDVLVKTMIYIAMLYIFKTKTTKKELEIHVILDEIGILSQRYLKELIEFANRYNIYFINGAPDEKLIGTYKRVFLVSNKNSKSIVQEIISS